MEDFDLLAAKKAVLAPPLDMTAVCFVCAADLEMHENGLDAFWWCPGCEAVPPCWSYRT